MNTFEFRDYIRAESYPPPTDDPPLPAEKVVHIIRRGLRTMCGLGQKHRVWRITHVGFAANVNADVWTVCPKCAEKSKPFLAVPQSSTPHLPDE